MTPALTPLVRLLFPAVCLSCRHDLPRIPAGPLCAHCVRSFRPPKREGWPPGVDSFAAATRFEGAARDIVHALKYRRKAYVAPLMASVLQERLRVVASGSDLIVPVPSPFIRRVIRGLNPAERIAESLGALVKLQVSTNALRRRVGFRSQTSLGRRDRFENAQRSFVRGSGNVKGKKVMLVDDVCTSGATLSACAAILRAAGAVRVTAIAFSREPLVSSGS